VRLRRQGNGLKVLSEREGQIFEALTDTYCAPDGSFPLVSGTDAVLFIDDLTARSSWRNQIGFHLLLAFADLLPIVRGYHKRFRKLEREQRAGFLHGLDKSRWTALALPGKLLKTLTMMSYYGDIEALRAAGYDPEANVARARALRAREARP
jgi:hypothetical protein